ncbi:MAG TPA: AAA family ATPase [Rhodopila sp.]|nr:AAA family ATPase [Rhodopila sp.]
MPISLADTPGLKPQHRMRRPSNLLVDSLRTPPVTRPPEPTRPTSYVDLYGLSKRPFGGKVEGAAYILFPSHRRAFELVVNHLLSDNGVVLLTGEEGIGKTEMLRAAADVAEGNGLHVIRLFRPPDRRLTCTELIAALTGDIEASPDDVVRTVQAGNRRAVLIDDFDLLPADCLSVLRPLMEMQDERLVMLLSGASGIRRPEVMPLLATLRNTVRLIPLSPAECRQFIERSLWVAGGTTRRLIEADAIRLVIAQSGGTPGRIGRLMEAALTAGFARGDAMITTRTIGAAIGPRSRPHHWQTPSGDGVVGRALAMMSIVLFLAGASVFAYKAMHGPQPSAPASIPHQPAAETAQEAAPPQAATLPTELIAALLKRGNDSLALGNLAVARSLFQKAAEGGSAAAALALGKTYDPHEPISQPGNADPGTAATWYRKAQALGDRTAASLLQRLAAQH